MNARWPERTRSAAKRIGSAVFSEKLDLYREHKADYEAGPQAALIDIAPATYLTIEGQGEPGGDAFHEAVQALYGTAFTIKMTRKFAGLGDYKVCALEGLWWSDNPSRSFWETPRATWRWKLIIRTPDFINNADLEQAREPQRKKGKGPAIERVTLEVIKEGPCVQILHVGPYADEAASVARMHAFANENGMRIDGLHHEIYLNDPRRTKPERLKTILRQPLSRS